MPRTAPDGDLRHTPRTRLRGKLRHVLARPLLQASFVVGERLIYLAPQLATVLLVSRTWGQAGFGEYALVLAWTRTFQGVINFGVTECLARDVGREPERRSSAFAHGLTLVVAFAGIGVAVMASCAWLMDYPPNVTRALLVGAMTLVPAGVLGACRGVLLGSGRVEYMAAVGAVESAVLLVLNVVVILSDAGLVALIAVMVGTQSLSALLGVALVHRRVVRLAGRVRGEALWRLFRTVLPFGLGTLLAFPATRLDILILSKGVGFDELGLYSAASKLFEFLFVLPLAFYMAMLPRTPHYLAAPPAERRDGLLRPLAWYFAALVPLTAGIALLAQPILHLLFGGEFVAGAALLRILMLAFAFMTAEVALAMLCKAAGFQSVDLLFTAVVTVLYTSGCLLLVPRLGAAGAAWSVAGGVLVGVVLRWRFVRRSVWPATRAA